LRRQQAAQHRPESARGAQSVASPSSTIRLREAHGELDLESSWEPIQYRQIIRASEH
jgi:hypothetical protein